MRAALSKAAVQAAAASNGAVRGTGTFRKVLCSLRLLRGVQPAARHISTCSRSLSCKRFKNAPKTSGWAASTPAKGLPHILELNQNIGFRRDAAGAAGCRCRRCLLSCLSRLSAGRNWASPLACAAAWLQQRRTARLLRPPWEAHRSRYDRRCRWRPAAGTRQGFRRPLQRRSVHARGVPVAASGRDVLQRHHRG